MVICTPYIEEYQREMEQAIQERMSGNLPVMCDSDQFDKLLQKYGVDAETMKKLRDAGCSNVAGLKMLSDEMVDTLPNLPGFQSMFLKKALADLRGDNANPQAPDLKRDAITIQGSSLNVTGISEKAKATVVQGGAVKSAGGNLNVKDSPVTAKDVKGEAIVGAIIE